MVHAVTHPAEIWKASDESRMVYGWASVSTMNGKPVVDRHGDVISTDTMVKMADSFMEGIRAAKTMHRGKVIGEVIHSLPVTAELAKAFGITTDREGWIVGVKIHDDRTWQMVKEGRLNGLSIGGRAQKRPIAA